MPRSRKDKLDEIAATVRSTSSSSAAASTASASFASWRCRGCGCCSSSDGLLLGLQRGAVAHDPRRPALPRERRDSPWSGNRSRERDATARERTAHRSAAADDDSNRGIVFAASSTAASAFSGCAAKPAEPRRCRSRSVSRFYDWLTRHRRVMPRHVFRGREATRRSGRACRHGCASPRPTTTPGSAIPSGWASNSIARCGASRPG